MNKKQRARDLRVFVDEWLASGEAIGFSDLDVDSERVQKRIAVILEEGVEEGYIRAELVAAIQESFAKEAADGLAALAKILKAVRA